MALTNKKSSYEITDGPSKADLIFALFHATYDHPHNVELTIYAPENGPAVRSVKLTIQINVVAREDGSGESWILDGHIITMEGHKHPNSSSSFNAYYSTKRRKGKLHVEF